MALPADIEPYVKVALDLAREQKIKYTNLQTTPGASSQELLFWEAKASDYDLAITALLGSLGD